MKYITYARVSTSKQGADGLGIEAQKSAIQNFVTSRDTVLKEFVEVESGRKVKRPQLLQAIELCKKEKATLLIAKLDRLARNATFVLSLRDSGVKFKCVDMPEANNLTIGLLAIIAEDEAFRTSKRVKSALAEIKKNITKNGEHTSKSGNVIKSLGKPQNLTNEARIKGNQVMKQKAQENNNNRLARAYIKSLLNQEMSYKDIAEDLNENGFKTARGGLFRGNQVARLVC